jgi:hypothetical protein
VLFAAWSNCDAGFVLGWSVLAVCGVFVRRTQFWLAAAASVLASGLNPNGFHLAAVAVWPLAPVVALPAGWLPKHTPLSSKWNWAIAAILLAAIALPVSQQRAFQFSSGEIARPTGAAKFLLAHPVEGPVFHTADQGGYLAWYLGPQISVHAPQLSDAQTIVLTAFDYPSGSPHYLIAELADPNQTQWKLAFQDAQGMVFLRQPPPGVRPLPNSAAIPSMEAQCAAHVLNVPGEPLCARELCKMFEHLGNLDRARFWLSYYLEHKKRPDPDAEVEYQRLTRR